MFKNQGAYGNERNNARDENASSASEVVVERLRCPAADECRAKVWSTVEKASQPDSLGTNSKFIEVEDLSTVYSSLIHTLYDS